MPTTGNAQAAAVGAVVLTLSVFDKILPSVYETKGDPARVRRHVAHAAVVSLVLAVAASAMTRSVVPAAAAGVVVLWLAWEYGSAAKGA